MHRELRRQLVHLSGILFIILAQVIGRFLAGLYFLLIAAVFFVYSEFVRREQKRRDSLLHAMEARLRDLATHFETRTNMRPFLGAFWFYFGCGITFLLFPLPIASLACLLLAVGDAFSTMVGAAGGRTRFLGNKTIEGSAAFFGSALLTALASSALLVSPPLLLWQAAAIVAVATLAEMLPALPFLRRLTQQGWLDDNLTIPLFTALVIILLV